MAEIKSTLDIIMEKTRGLALSEEEKKAYRLRGLEEKVRGWVLKYTSGSFSRRAPASFFEEEWAAPACEVEVILKRELIERIDINGDNHKVFELAEGLLNVRRQDIEIKLNKIKRRLEEVRTAIEDDLLAMFKGEEISGNAVIPNAEFRSTWKETCQDITNGLRENIFR